MSRLDRLNRERVTGVKSGLRDGSFEKKRKNLLHEKRGLVFSSALRDTKRGAG